MRSDRDLWRAVRWSLPAVAVAIMGIGVAAVLDRTAAREWALTIGGPVLTVLLPVGLVWLLVGRASGTSSDSAAAAQRPVPASRPTDTEGGGLLLSITVQRRGRQRDQEYADFT